MKKSIKNIKVFVCSAVLLFPLVSSTYSDNAKSNAILEIESEYDNKEVEIETTYVEPTLEVTTTTVTTTMPVTTTVVTTTEPVDEYKHIRNLEVLKNNDLTIEELDFFINKYAGYTKLSYEDALKVINDNIDSIESDYQSIRGGIMVTLFNHSNEIGLLSPYTCDREIREDMTQEEKESTMLEFCDNLCMCNDDKAIVLAAFREETGRGTSYMCVQNNNYGGIRIYGEAGCNGEYGMYSTPEFGMYREVSLINKKLTSIRSEGTSELSSVVYSFACRYNPDYADHYSGKILNWVYDVYNDYGDFTSKQKVYS